MHVSRRGAWPLFTAFLLVIGCGGGGSDTGAARETDEPAMTASAEEKDGSGTGTPHDNGDSHEISDSHGKETGRVKHKNQLANETSPYLLQHADNPVDWYPWGDEAISRAREEDKPILISVGYSACHWCHVMEHESFENEEIAKLMNDLFVCIKIDREERPDLDEIYMTSVQMMTGSGGWPLNVFLTPDLKPFFGGTYFPSDPKYGRQSWPQVLTTVSEAYRLQRDRVEEMGEEITQRLRSFSNRPGGGEDQLLSPAVLDKAVSVITGSFDQTYGGFGSAPKFPRTMDLSFVLRAYAKGKDVENLRVVSTSLDSMAAGGMYDQLGGGFHRYSTDERWLVPHFEKMLYDNALLSRLYAEAYQATGQKDYARITRETLDWVAREMTSPSGGFYSSLDADSEGEEGKFYVWDYVEVVEILGEDDARLFSRMYDVDEGGNWEGKSIPHMVKNFQQMAELAGTDIDGFLPRWQGWKDKLLERRGDRIWPGLDDKILTDWNGLMISGCARSGRILGEPRYVEMGAKAADFILKEMRDGDEILHSHRAGTSAIAAMLDDYAFFIAGLLDLWEATFDPRWVDEAKRLQAVQDKVFRGDGSAAYFVARQSDDLLVRMKNGHDGALPNGNAIAAHNLTRLARLTGDSSYEDGAVSVLKHFMPTAQSSPQSYAQLLMALDFTISPSQEIVFVGDPSSSVVESLVGVVWEQFRPHVILAGVPVDGDGLASGPMKDSPLVKGRSLVDGRPAVYVCENYACKAPVTTASSLRTALNGD